MLVGVILCICAQASLSDHLKVTSLTAKQLNEGFVTGEFTSEQVVASFLNRIEKYESTYNAFISINPDALEDARAMDQRRKSGELLGPLSSIPVIIKETADVAGLPSTAGWENWNVGSGGIQLIPQIDAPVVARLREAGAIIIGKGNVPAFSGSATNANSSWAGPTYNAIDRRLIPGASSTGVATAVAADFVVLGLAEETGGSIQNPAAAQSLVGIKPTFGLVPTAGMVPLCGSTRDVAGVHAKTVEDAAMMLDVIAGYTANDPKTILAVGHVPKSGYTEQLDKSAIKGKRIGLYGPGWSGRGLTAETESLYDRAISELESLGAVVIEDPFSGSDFAEEFAPKQLGYGSDCLNSYAYDFDQYLRRAGAFSNVDSVHSLIKMNDADPFVDGTPMTRMLKILYADQAAKTTPVDPFTAEGRQVIKRIMDAIKIPEKVVHNVESPDMANDIRNREAHLAVFNQVMDKYRLDALIFPQMFKSLPSLNSGDPYPVIATPQINIAGLPGITVPAGRYKGGSPFSLIFIGRAWSEADLLTMAFAYEQATGLRIMPVLSIEGNN